MDKKKNDLIESVQEEFLEKTAEVGAGIILANEIMEQVKIPGRWFLRDNGFIEFQPDNIPGIKNYMFARHDEEQNFFVSQTRDDGITEIFPEVEYDDLIDELNHPKIK